MAKKVKKTNFTASKNRLSTGEPSEVAIPDEAIYYIVSNYMQNQSVSGVPLVVGVSAKTVQDVIQLLVDWSDRNGYIEDGIIKIGAVKR